MYDENLIRRVSMSVPSLIASSMRQGLLAIAGSAYFLAVPVYGLADNCIDLIRLSRTVSAEISSKDDFKKTVNAFCEDYNESSSSGKKANYGGAYELLQLSMGKSSRSEQNVARKYCASAKNSLTEAALYKRYLEGISPGAYEAYFQCLKAREDGIAYSLVVLTRNKLILSIDFKPTKAGDKAVLKYESSDSVGCKWDEKNPANSSSFTIDSNKREQITLVCTRQNPSTKPINETDFVYVYRKDKTGSRTHIPWQKYNVVGEPVHTLAMIESDLNKSLMELKDDLAETTNRLDDLKKRNKRYLNQRQWYNKTKDRVEDIEYLNSTSFPIEVAVTSAMDKKETHQDCDLEIFIDGLRVIYDVHTHGKKYRQTCSGTVTVPPKATYKVQTHGYKGRSKIKHWFELSVSDRE